jgi:hypothetical protein
MKMSDPRDTRMRFILELNTTNARPISAGSGLTAGMDPVKRGAIVNHRQFDAHLQFERYGDFQLTDAIRPGPGLPVIPRQGFRQAVYRDYRHRLRIPVIAASVSRERLFEVFLALLQPLSEVVDVILETSHRAPAGKHRDLRRTHIDKPVLTSYCCEYEDLLMNDGCTGIAIMSSSEPMEVQFDEHKLLMVYARDLKPFSRILKVHGVPRDDEMKLISEGEHLHGSEESHYGLFRELCYRIGVGRLSSVVNE